MRLMFLSVTGTLGGAERSLLDVLASLREAQPEWALHLLVGSDGPLVARAQDIGVETTRLPIDAALEQLGESGVPGVARLAAPAAAYVGRLGRALARFRPDVVHSNSLKMHLFGAWARPRRSSLVWHLHDYLGTRPSTTRLLRWSARRCSAVVANSDSVAADARAALGDRLPLLVVHNAVDLDRFSQSGGRLDLDGLAGLPVAEGPVVRVGLVATFGHWKGHATFLEALARLPAGLPVRGYVIGGPLYRTAGSQRTLEALRTQAVALGLEGRLGFTGFVDHPDAALRSLDIVVHASTAPEPFGLVIAEAMACGRAVIASDAGGAREVFTPGVDAVGHVPGSADSLAARIAELARDPARRARLGLAGRATAERRFDRRRLAAELVPIYRRLGTAA